jgi:RNA polymerase sigma factor (sigma-70 family)
MMSSSELELARQAARGDLAAFGALVRTHEPKLRRFTHRIAGDDGDVLAQETLLAAWRALGQWRGEGTLAAWLRTIATRRFLDQRRTLAGRARHAPLAEAGDIRHCEETERRVRLDRALARLPDRERAAALLVFGEGHTHSEAATMLGVPLGTLKSLVARARTGLMPLLEGIAT